MDIHTTFDYVSWGPTPKTMLDVSTSRPVIEKESTLLTTTDTRVIDIKTKTESRSQSPFENHRSINSLPETKDEFQIKDLKDQMLVCAVCGYSSIYKEDIQNHMTTHAIQDRFECERCNKTFTQRVHLKRHMLLHTGERPYKCLLCEKEFTQKFHLKRHNLTHTGEKPFKCISCEKEFTQKFHLKRHMLTHTGDKLYECEVCQKSFTQKISLLRHSIKHDPNYKNSDLINLAETQCHICSKIFSQKVHLKRHMLTHTGEKPYMCTICDKDFTQKFHLKRHQMTHSGEKHYECPMCGKTFIQKIHLQRHHSTPKACPHTIIGAAPETSRVTTDCDETETVKITKTSKVVSEVGKKSGMALVNKSEIAAVTNAITISGEVLPHFLVPGVFVQTTSMPTQNIAQHLHSATIHHQQPPRGPLPHHLATHELTSSHLQYTLPHTHHTQSPHHMEIHPHRETLHQIQSFHHKEVLQHRENLPHRDSNPQRQTQLYTEAQHHTLQRSSVLQVS